MNNNCYYSRMQLLQLLLLLLISLTLCINPEVTPGAIQNAREELESEELEISLKNNVQTENRNGFVELLTFIDSVSHALTAVNEKLTAQDGKFNTSIANTDVQKGEVAALHTTIAAQDTKFITLNAKMDDQKVGFHNLSAKITALETEFSTVNAKIDELKTEVYDLKSINKSVQTHFANTNIKIDAQNVEFPLLYTKIDRLTTKTDNLLQFNLNSYIDGLIKTQAGKIKTGKSFNGSTLPTIKSQTKRFGELGRHTVIVFVNHLDEAIDDFAIYDGSKTIYNPAPTSVPARTQEVFTFAHPTRSYSAGLASFSYVIPNMNIRIAAFTWLGGHSAGLAFVRKGMAMKTYYDSNKGIEGSSVFECCGWVDRSLYVGYENIYARMFVDTEGSYEATLRIELIKLSLED